MIGKTIYKYRSTPDIQSNKDVSLRAIVLSLSIAMLVFQSKVSLAQSPTGAKSNAQANPKPSKSVSTKAPVDDDDNGDDEGDADDDVSPPDKAKNPGVTGAPGAGKKEVETQGEASDLADLIENPPAATGESGEKKNRKNTEEAAQEATEEMIDESDKTAANPDENKEPDEQASEPDAVPEEEEPKEEITQEAPPVELPVVKKEPDVPAAEPAPSPEKLTEADYVEVIPRERNVELVPAKKYSDYRDRRSTHGFLFNFNAENLYFPDYTSIVDSKLYEEMFGQEDIVLAQFQVDYKLNFFLGSIIAGLGYGQGTIIDDRTLEERSLTLKKSSVRLQYLLDSLMKEPYFVPYVGFDYWKIGISERNLTTKTSTNIDTGLGDAITVGFLLQLNWIEPETAKLAYLNQGLENTYLDIFWTQYNGSTGETDPILENDFNFGVGLRMEF